MAEHNELGRTGEDEAADYLAQRTQGTRHRVRARRCACHRGGEDQARCTLRKARRCCVGEQDTPHCAGG